MMELVKVEQNQHGRLVLKFEAILSKESARELMKLHGIDDFQQLSLELVNQYMHSRGMKSECYIATEGGFEDLEPMEAWKISSTHMYDPPPGVVDEALRSVAPNFFPGLVVNVHQQPPVHPRSRLIVELPFKSEQGDHALDALQYMTAAIPAHTKRKQRR